MALGPRDTASLVMLAGWDATELQNFKLQDGTPFTQVVADLNSALGLLNAELTNDSLWSGLMSFTDQPDLEYRVGASNGMTRFTEYGRPDAQRADTEGHMLPLIKWDRMLGWTWLYLKEARMAQVQADIFDAIKDVRDRFRITTLTRLLKRGDDSGAANGLGTAGESPGFATDEGSTAVDFIPPANAGTSFDNTHEHYVGIAGGVFTVTVFDDAFDELREHGHEPPFEFLIGPSDRVAVEDLTGFAERGDPLIQYGSSQDLARVGDDYIGTIGHFRIREVRGIPQYYGFGYKSYGSRSQRNPLRTRIEKGTSALTVQAFTDPRSGAGAVYPLQNIMLFTEFGVGVGDRTNGTARYVNNATWADGTAT